MARSREETDYNSLTETLINTFGTVLSRDVIYTIVESCSGDLNYAANAIMSITNECDIGLDSGSTEVQNSNVNIQPNIQQDDREYIIDNEVAQPTAAPSDINATIHNAPSNENVNTISYAQASMLNSSKQSSRQSTKSPMKTVPTDRIYKNNIWTETIRRIVTYHNKGTRTLIFMRGAPGSGKSYLARQIVEITVGARAEHLHIFSTDDFFIRGGVYSFDKMWLSDAHAWNKKRSTEAMKKGVSPVIIDNTNIDAWEMLPYVMQGVQRGYVIEIVEPDTPWSRNLSQLTARNTHNVPQHRIQRMLDLLDNIKYEKLLHALKIVYPTNMQPPVLRCFPEIMPNCDNSSINVDSETIECEQSAFLHHDNTAVVDIDAQVDDNVHSVAGIENSSTSFECTNQVEAQDYPMFAANFDGSTHNECQNITLLPDSEDQAKRQLDTEERMQINVTVDNIEHHNNNDDIEESFESNDNTENMRESPQPSAVKCTPVKEYELNYDKILEDFERVENEWENGEAWDEDIKSVSNSANNKSDFMISTEAKPPREKKSYLKDDSLSLVNNDWRKITLFMPSFTENSDPPVGIKQNVVETKSTETSMDIGDTDIYKNQYKVISAVNRDINLNYVPNLSEKVPKNPMLDKSSMTNEATYIAKKYRCKNEDKHFVRFRNMFKNLNKDDLRYIFDKCCGDVNWAVSIVLDDMATNKIEPVRGDVRSDTEDENEEPCDCTAHYDIIPDITPTRIADEADENISVAVPSTSRNSYNGTTAVVKKQKKDAPLSDTSLALKRQIEQNIIMSGEYHSINYVKARKLRYRQMYGDLDNSEAIDNINSENTETISFDVVNTDTCNQDNNAPSALEDVDSECDSDNDSGLINVEKTVNINIGYEFLGQLDKLFGRGDMVYSENIEPRINMPISLLNEINALWMESLMYQLEAESKVHEDIIKQDEEFARELARKEEEVRESGKESEVPNLKEVMDLEFALALYRKDCDEWQKDRPTDIAAKLSAQKLYNLFPEIPHRDLDEIHMAHHNDFQATVGVLLMSSGRSDLVEDENGVNKFVMAGELQRQQKILNEEKEKIQNEIEWPALPSRITLDVVNNYRNEAETHLQNRQMSFGKAQDYMSRGMPMVASFYSDVARLHTLKYEQAQSIAAASLMQFHAERYENSETLDLHYLRVAEAKEALDIFLDTHIQHLRDNIGKKNVTLYFITGRGLHSSGGPKVKPAVKRRLRERNLGYCERNPGLLTVKVCAGDMLSYQIT